MDPEAEQADRDWEIIPNEIRKLIPTCRLRVLDTEGASDNNTMLEIQPNATKIGDAGHPSHEVPS